MENRNKIEQLRSALESAESSIRQIKQLLSEMEKSPVASSNSGNAPSQPKKELPGILGSFDGEQMVTDKGEKYPVPENYASKSLLIVGDTLKLVEEGKEKRFKQIEHVKRHKSLGILTKKDGKWKVVTSEGSYKVLPAAVSHFGADVGDEISLHIPAANMSVAYGAIESVMKKANQDSEEEQEIVETTPKVENKKPVQKEEKKKPSQEKSSGNKKQEPKAIEKKEIPKKEVEYKEVEVEAKPAEKVELPPVVVKDTVDEDELT